MISEQESKRLRILILVAALLLCIAVLPGLPDGYFLLLRGIVFSVAIYAAVLIKNHETLHKHFVVLVLINLLFNPFFPVFLPPILWLLVDLGTAVYFLTLSKKMDL